MNARSTGLTAAYPAGTPRPRNDDAGRNIGLVRWRQPLESRWQRKIDEVVALSRARCGLSGDPDETLAVQEVGRSRRLAAKTALAYDELAVIEEALARLDGGSYGACACCGIAMSEEWLADQPEAPHCPDCALRLVSWVPQTERTVIERAALACRSG